MENGLGNLIGKGTYDLTLLSRSKLLDLSHSNLRKGHSRIDGLAYPELFQLREWRQQGGTNRCRLTREQIVVVPCEFESGVSR